MSANTERTLGILNHSTLLKLIDQYFSSSALLKRNIKTVFAKMGR